MKQKERTDKALWFKYKKKKKFLFLISKTLKKKKLNLCVTCLDVRKRNPCLDDSKNIALNSFSQPLFALFFIKAK